MEGDSQRPYSGTNFRFLPTPSAWRATVQNLQPPDPSKFLPTPSHGGRRDQHSVQIYRDGWRRLRQQRVDSSTRHISTHALTWRATQRDSRALPFLFISTHALTWRATYTIDSPLLRARDFYPRPHMEGDFSMPRPAPGTIISTHALTWRAT